VTNVRAAGLITVLALALGATAGSAATTATAVTQSAHGPAAVPAVAGTAVAETAAAGTAGATNTATADQTPHPAVWVPHALIVDLPNLPKRYTCDELWYKFRDVLFAIGARPDMKVLPYRCESALGPRAYAPKVQLEFSTPRVVTGKDTKWADMQVVTKSVRLAPGELPHFDDQDCALLDLMKSTLLRYIGATVGDFHLACRAPPSSLKPPFGLTVQALVPATQAQPSVARATQGRRTAR
jgi:hypothetical protein